MERAAVIAGRDCNTVVVVPHESLKLKPGVNQNETPALNEAGISYSNLIRFNNDSSGQGLGLPQKIGGWTRYYPYPLPAPIRALCAWQDLNANTHLAYGTQNITSSFSAQVGVISSGVLQKITPQNGADNVPPIVATSSGSATITITDATLINVTSFDSVYITTHLSVGGVVLFGLYQCAPLTSTTYTVQSADALGFPLAATSNATLGAVAQFTTTIASQTVQVTLANHGYSIGSTFPILLPTTVNGVTLYGNYLVQSVTSSSVFSIQASTAASASGSGFINGGNVAYVYNFSVGGSSGLTGFGAGGFGTGGFGAGSSTSVPGIAVSASDWTLGAWGEILVASPIQQPISLNAYFGGVSSGVDTLAYTPPLALPVGQPVTISGAANATWNGNAVVTSSPVSTATTSASGSGAIATIGITSLGFTPAVGAQVVIAGVMPAGYNGTYLVVANPPPTTTSVSVASMTTGAQTVAGTASFPDTSINLAAGVATTTAATSAAGTATVTFVSPGFTPTVGGTVIVAGITPIGFNGTYTITAATATTVSYANATAGPQTIAGTVTFSLPATGAMASASVSVNQVPFQPLFIWDPVQNNAVMQVIPQAPPVNDGFFIAMPQRQIVTWGSTQTGIQDPLLVSWCDVSNFSVWIGTAVNQAGTYRIPTGNKIVGGLQASQQGILWTDLDTWSMQYIGPPNVYGFNKIGDSCGLISRKAAAAYMGSVYWMGINQFFSLTGTGLAPMDCPVRDFVFQQLDRSNLSKIRVAVNTQFSEVSWFFPTLYSGGENAAYVKYNAQVNCWDVGYLGRSAWIDQSVVGAPVAADPSTLNLVQHETSKNALGSPINSVMQTGFFAMSEADQKIFVDEVWPDMRWGLYGGSLSSTVQISFLVADFPSSVASQAMFNGGISGNTLTVNYMLSGTLAIGQYVSAPGIANYTQITAGSGLTWTVSGDAQNIAATGITASAGPISVYGPYSVTTATNWFNPRFRGRLVAINVQSTDVDSFWRLGNIRYRAQPDGKY